MLQPQLFLLRANLIWDFLESRFLKSSRCKLQPNFQFVIQPGFMWKNYAMHPHLFFLGNFCIHFSTLIRKKCSFHILRTPLLGRSLGHP